MAAFINGNKIAIHVVKKITEGDDLRIDELDVKANGTYNASDYGCDAFNTVNVNVPNTCEHVGLHVEKNGTYKASDYGRDGFDTVIVDVPQTGGEDLAEIDAALDNIIAKQEALIRGTIIFRLQYNAAGVQDEFIAKRGMTWGEWVDSEYNRNPFNANETLLYNDNGDSLFGTYGDEYVYNSNNEIQTLWDVIVAGGDYYL